MTTATSLKEEVISVLDQLPADRLAEVLDFALFVKARAQRSTQYRTFVRPEAVPRSDLMALKGIVSWGGDAVEDAERLYDGND